MRDEPKKRVKIRIFTLLVFFYLGFIGIALRTYQLQVIEAPRLQALARQQYVRKFALKSPRGVIYDRNRSELAVNRRGYSIARTEKLKDPQGVASKLAPLLGMDRERLARKLGENENFVWLSRQVSEEQGEAVKVLGLEGIAVLPEERRFYPGGEILGQILGFTGLDGEGLEGLEKYYERELRGRPRYLTVERDNRGALMMFSEDEDKTDQPASLVLTIDQALQHLAEQKVKDAVLAHGAKRGCLLAMDPRRGNILALAIYPYFNPNYYSNYRGRDWRVWPLTEVYEPGSTFKVITFASAIEEGRLKPEDKINCENGNYVINGDTIHDMHNYDILSAADVLAKSSNIGAAKVAERLGSELFRNHILQFGFGQKTGIDFPADAKGLVRPLRQWYPITLRTIGFGQGISVTPLQMLVALSAIANGGELVRPFLAEKLVYADGSEHILNRPLATRRVISQQTSEKMKELLVRVVTEGTGKNAAIPGYTVAGKTGTAQKARSGYAGYEPGKWVCSFMGFAPAEDPKLAMIVLIDEPRTDYATGGLIAAPVFQEVMKYALTTMSILPDAISIEQFPGLALNRPAAANGLRMAAVNSLEPGIVPDFKGLDLKQALNLSLQLGLEPKLLGSGWVIEQDPAPGSAAGDNITLRLSEKRI
jgi:cell division protein FtsI (penicillin-binding protein 3)